MAGLCCKRLQASTVGAEAEAGEQLAALLAMLIQECEQRQLLRQDALQAGQVALAEGLEFGVDQLKQLLGGADIVVE